jgi:serine/threonine protein kinase
MNQIGRYEIVSELGRGGMATVYLAHDPRIDRQVAIKVLPPAFLHDPSFRARFAREARTIAALEHTAIVPVHDYGEENGQLYLVMRYMPGGSLADRLKGGPLPLAEIAHITGRLAAALDEAHSRHIIHRDLKPDNILFDRHGEPYLSDFGIVKVAESSVAYTGSLIIGTPAYMSPEQAHGGREIDGRSDIYSLGVILFEMLTGRAPYQGDTPMQLAMKHILDPVPSILAHKSDLPPGLEAILARALAKEPADRFNTAGELAEAISAVASGKVAPTTQLLERPADPPRSSLPAPRSSDHQPPPAVIKARFAIPWWVGLLGGIVVIGLLFRAIFNQVEPTPPPPFTPFLTPTATPTVRPTQQIIIRTQTPPPPLRITTVETFRTLRGHSDFVNSVAWSPVTTLLASGSQDGEVIIWDGLSGQTMLELNGHANSVNSVAWSADGRLLASGSDDTTVKIWDSSNGVQVAILQSTAAVNSLAWSPDRVGNGRQLVLGNEDGSVEVWDVDSGRQLQLLTTGGDPINGVSWSADGTLLAAGGADAFVHVWEADSGRLLLSLDSNASAVTSVAWSADSRFLASGGADGTIQIWDGATGQQLRLLEGHDRFVNGVAWAPDSQHLVSGSGDQTIRVWDALSGLLISTVNAHLDTVTEVAWSADGDLVASGGRDQVVRTWRVQ